VTIWDRETAERRLAELAPLVAEALGGGWKREKRDDGVELTQYRLTGALAKMIDTCVGCDAEKPGRHGLGRTQIGETAMRTQQDLLQEILGVTRVADHADHVSEKPVSVLIENLLLR
jgi:hypothetical protein